MTFVRRWLAALRVLFGIGTREDIALVHGMSMAEYDNLLVAMGAAWQPPHANELVTSLRVYAGVEMTRAMEAPEPNEHDIRHARLAARLADEIAMRAKRRGVVAS